MPTSDSFERAYKGLNNAQKKAVDTVEGPVMVVAGPGTGKTQILSLRIANILVKTDSAPSGILAIAFTESAVKAMCKRLLSIIGSRAYELSINTFHGFANDRIQEFPDVFPRIIGAEPITEIDRISIVEKILEDGTWEILRPSGDPVYYVQPVLSTIQSLKREGYNPERFLKYVNDQQDEYDRAGDKVHEKGAYKGEMKAVYKELQQKIEKNKELVKVFSLYETELQTRRVYDFEDMILEVMKAMESNETFLRILQERYQYILVDEYQDTNGSQARMIELLASFHENPNLFIVGDEKQAVYRFQGASLQNFEHFIHKYPSATVINLEENYRSTQRILDASHNLILKNSAVLTPKALRSQLKHIHSIEVVEAANEETEADFVGDEIQKTIAQGVLAQEIAVIYRNNRDSEVMERALTRRAIPYTVYSNKAVFEDLDIAQLLILLEYISHIDRDDLLGEIIFYDFLKIDFLTAANALKEAKESRRKLQEVIKEKVPETWNTLVHLAGIARNKPLHQSIEDIINESGFLAHIMQGPESHDKAEVLRVIISEAEEYIKKNPQVTIVTFIDHVNSLKEHGLALTQNPSLAYGVQLMTAHRSKGLEFEHVYVTGAYDGHWGNKRSMSHFHIPKVGSHGVSTIEDERRLFYVALTRAKRSLTISYPTVSTSGKELLPSQFIEEIGDEHVTKKQIVARNLLAQVATHTEQRLEQYRTFLKELFKEQGLSVTAINAYLDCPWRYFFNNLLRIPRLKTTPELFGTAIHEALRHLYTDGEYLESFRRTLKRMPLGEREYEESLKKGEEVLKEYYKKYKDSIEKNIRTEYPIEMVFQDITLHGIVDKIIFNDDKGTMMVFDYKTGAPKTRNHILGKTKSGNAGDYWRQLRFYKLLLDENVLSKRYVLSEGVVDFVEPDDKGNFHREAFPITNEDVNELKADITKVIDEISSLEFLNHQCKEDCTECKMAKRMFDIS